MKKYALGIVLAFLLSSTQVFPVAQSFSIQKVEAAVKVKGYYRKDGTYVKPHYRSDPDGIIYNNWSYPGNTNPYTGVTAPGGSDFYLKSNTSTTKNSETSSSKPQDTSCGPNSYFSSLGGCNCDSGYARRLGKCVFESCPAGSQLIGSICKPTTSSMDLSQHKLCLTQKPCTCEKGYIPVGNRKCIPSS